AARTFRETERKGSVPGAFTALSVLITSWMVTTIKGDRPFGISLLDQHLGIYGLPWLPNVTCPEISGRRNGKQSSDMGHILGPECLIGIGNIALNPDPIGPEQVPAAAEFFL